MSNLISTIGELNEKQEFSVLSNIEPQWLKEFRQRSWKTFLSLPWESDSNMLNFVQPKLLKSLEVNYPAAIKSNNTSLVDLPQEKHKTNLFFSPKEFGLSFSPNTPERIQKAFIVKPLDTTTINEGDQLEDLKQIFNLSINDKLSALTNAIFKWGSFIQVKEDNLVLQPVTIRYKSFTDDSSSYTGFHIIDIKDGVELTLELIFESTKLDYDFSNTIIRVGRNCHVNILINENGLNNRKTTRSLITLIGKDASLNFAHVQTDGNYIRHRSEFRFIEEGGNFTGIACMRGYEKQIYDFYSAVLHQVPNATSNTIVRGVMDDEALGLFKGNVDITKKAPQTKTDLNLSGLLLSKKARFHSIPAMEVSNSNVKASHGASVSKIDLDQIFYLQTRGISEDEAEHMISSGYFAPALEMIRNQYLRKQAYTLIEKAIEAQYAK
ncbi:MAG: SufD family Fe-S cluster assembly protein [Candidatus Hodarchaeales archaeon]|jgi:Fe-S cluster assembly scaffold protein SufB